MSIEQKINYQLNKFPAVKKVIKRIYQRIMYAISPKIKSEGNIIRISPDDPNHEYFFGYYDKSPWDITDRYVLCMRANNTWSDVSPKEKADILLIDTSLSESDENRVKKIAETSSWNVQQGCMLQWLGPDFSSHIIYNDCREGKYISVILELATGVERIIHAPVYTVPADGKTALTLDFSRLYNLRPGYGYYNVPEKTKGIALPDATAVWKIDLENGEIQPLLNYKDFSSFQPRHEMQEEGSVHKVNHLMLSPSGKRCMVLYRWFIGQRKYTRLITFDVADGKDMYVLSDDDMVSHCCWKDDEHILAFENKKDGGPGYYLMKDKSQEYIHCWPQLSNDGHPSYSPDKKLIVTDTYPNRARIAEIKIMDGTKEKKDAIKIVAGVFAPFRYDNDTRCDLHPRWCHNGNKICFDTVFKGRRGLYEISLTKASQSFQGNNRCKDSTCGTCKSGVKTDAIPLLYVVDTLKQRYGVTSVVMNYYRNINRNEVAIDFLAYEDSEKKIIEEIKEAGGIVYFMPKLSLRNVKKFIQFLNHFFEEHKEYRILHSHFNQIDSILFPIARKYGNRVCISHSHNTKYSDYPIRAIRNAIMCLPLKYEADIWAACGIKAGEFLYGREFMNSPKHIIINNAIDVEKFEYNEEVRNRKRTELGLKKEFVLGNVGSLKPQKNQIFLLKVFAELIRKTTDDKKYKLLIIGDGELKDNLIQEANKLRIRDKVMFLGTRSDVPELLQTMDIFVLPSLYEGLPVVGIEAQASGLPCLFSECITKEVMLCNTKYLSITNNISEWVQAIVSNKDFSRQDVGEVIKNRGYSIKDEARKLTAFYNTL